MVKISKAEFQKRRVNISKAKGQTFKSSWSKFQKWRVQFQKRMVIISKTVGKVSKMKGLGSATI